MLADLIWSFFAGFCTAAALSTGVVSEKWPFSCTGGTIYFSAHPVDGLLYQNPDLLRELHVLKCITTVVFTSGGRGHRGSYSQSLERGLQEAYALMAGISASNSAREEAIVRVGTHDLHSWSLRGMPNIQIIYLRLPDSSSSGQGYDASGEESMSKLYRKEIGSITSTDGASTYTLRDLKELIAFMLRASRPNDIRILNHKATIANTPHPSDHLDHVTSAKLVHGIIVAEQIIADVHVYGGSNIRKFEANIDSTHETFAQKATSFFEYAAYDEQMCHSLDECVDRLDNEQPGMVADDDLRYVAQYLAREYYVT
ncbi:hypothetical protein FB567DRAFT_263386 [Paraphoma chrysanthemicola]|uniref:Uncharacterized protein n=1 Tax=Paraphoma chrysanthemicola TaxID=798071 RepID=A0A8K0RBX1_9PLEO|nr:hypothetical protein FB567DRAFT_263386 [Paraphoma chrysanthemicola]